MNTLTENIIKSPTIPTVGRTVHYYAYGTPGGEYKPNELRAAIITDVSNYEKDGTIGLCVLNPSGMWFNQNVLYSDVPKGGCWGWPPRV